MHARDFTKTKSILGLRHLLIDEIYFSEHGAPLERLVGNRVLPVQAIDQPAQLTRRYGQRLLVVGVLGPVETALLETSAMQPETVRRRLNTKVKVFIDWASTLLVD